MLFALIGFAGSLHHRGMRSNGAICGGYVFNRHGFNYQDSHHRSCNFCGVKEEETVTYDGHWYWIVDRRTNP